MRRTADIASDADRAVLAHGGGDRGCGLVAGVVALSSDHAPCWFDHAYVGDMGHPRYRRHRIALLECSPFRLRTVGT
jgi:hypothetical protein